VNKNDNNQNKIDCHQIAMILMIIIIFIIFDAGAASELPMTCQ